MNYRSMPQSGAWKLILITLGAGVVIVGSVVLIGTFCEDVLGLSENLSGVIAFVVGIGGPLYIGYKILDWLTSPKGDINRLWLYVSRWTRYLWGGLSAMVSHAGGIKRYFVFVLNQLQIKGMSLNALNPTVL